MAIIVFAGLSGWLFGFGLSVSQMIDPAKVLGFLDLFGAWDPTLAFVMGGGLLVTVPGYWWLQNRCTTPYCAATFHAPINTTVDGQLLLGSALFGIGWGLAGYCPGPLLTSLALVPESLWPFALAMGIGWLITDRLSKTPS